MSRGDDEVQWRFNKEWETACLFSFYFGPHVHRQKSMSGPLGSTGMKHWSAEKKNTACWFWLAAANAMVTEGWPQWRTGLRRVTQAQQSPATYKQSAPPKGPFCLCYKSFQNKLPLDCLGYHGDRWRAPTNLLSDWLPDKEQWWRHQWLSEMLRDFPLEADHHLFLMRTLQLLILTSSCAVVIMPVATRCHLPTIHVNIGHNKRLSQSAETPK